MNTSSIVSLLHRSWHPTCLHSDQLGFQSDTISVEKLWDSGTKSDYTVPVVVNPGSVMHDFATCIMIIHDLHLLISIVGVLMEARQISTNVQSAKLLFFVAWPLCRFRGHSSTPDSKRFAHCAPY